MKMNLSGRLILFGTSIMSALLRPRLHPVIATLELPSVGQIADVMYPERVIRPIELVEPVLRQRLTAVWHWRCATSFDHQAARGEFRRVVEMVAMELVQHLSN